MNRCLAALVVMLALVASALPVLAGDADANSLLGKPTQLMSRKHRGDSSSMEMPGAMTFSVAQLSPDGRWLIYWKSSQPLPEIEVDGPEGFMGQMQVRMNQQGEILLRDLRTGKETNLLGKVKVRRKQAVGFNVADCFSPSGSHALVSILRFADRPDRAIGPPECTDLYLVSLAKKPEARKIKIAEKLAIGVCLPRAEKALLAATSNVEGDAMMPPLKLLGLSEEGSGKTHEQKGIPVAAHGKKAIVAVHHPRRPKSIPRGSYKEMQWHPAQLHLVDAETGKTLQRPNLHPKHSHRPIAFFLGKSDRIAYADTDVVQEPGGGREQAMQRHKPAVRVWDMKKKNITREFRDRRLIGLGPTEATLVITGPSPKDSRATHRDVVRPLLADIETGKTWPITSQGCICIAARGGKLLYETIKDGKAITHVAEIQLPEELRKRQDKR